MPYMGVACTVAQEWAVITPCPVLPEHTIGGASAQRSPKQAVHAYRECWAGAQMPLEQAMTEVGPIRHHPTVTPTSEHGRSGYCWTMMSSSRPVAYILIAVQHM